MPGSWWPASSTGWRLEYSRRLRAAGVPCELHEVPGMYHGADVLYGYRTPLTAGLPATMTRALRRAARADPGPGPHQGG
jgi:acetyl esterase/lipase